MTEITQQFKQQLPRNATMTIISFLTYAVAAVILTPYLRSHLGDAAYGLIPLAGLFTQYIAIITQEIASSVNRFMTIEIHKPDGNPNIIFNTAFAFYLLLILIQIPLFALGLFYADKLFSIPEGLKTDTILMLGCSACGFLIGLLRGVFVVSVFSNNRLDISSGMNITRAVSRFVLIILLFSLLGPRLRYIGYVELGINAVLFCLSVYYCKKLSPQLYIAFNKVSPRILKPVFHMSLWTLLNRLGSLLYTGTDIWIINRFISPVIAGQYAVLVVITRFLQQIGILGATQIGPTIMNMVSKQKHQELSRMLIFSVKLMCLGLAIPVGMICFTGETILRLWLIKDFSPSLPGILTILTVHLFINIGINPLFQLQTASNRVKIPGLVTFAIGAVNITASYGLGVVAGMGASGVALVTAVVLTAKNAVFTPLYGAHILGLPRYTFFRPLFSSSVLLGIIYLTSLVPICQLLGFDIVSFGGLAVKSTFMVLVAMPITWFCLISKEERGTLLSFFFSKS